MTAPKVTPLGFFFPSALRSFYNKLVFMVLFCLIKKKKKQQIMLKIFNIIFRCKVAWELALNGSMGNQEMEERGEQEVQLMWECLKNWTHETFIITWLHSELLMFCLCAQVTPVLKMNVYHWLKEEKKQNQTVTCTYAVIYFVVLLEASTTAMSTWRSNISS